MKTNRVLAVIPARYASTRFPGKPLAPIAGKPMVAHVVARAVEAGCFAEVVVATDDERIAAAASAAGARPVMTGECRSGTDRVAAAAREADASVVLNVQGDEPALPPENLRLLAEFLLARPDAPIATLALPGTREDLDNPNVVKVVCGGDGRALYFSRAAIPYPRNAGPAPVRRHVGLYGFQKAALLEFAGWPESGLERVEALEQLRALENGMAIHVLAARADSVAVDVPADVPRAELALAALARQGSAVRGQGPGRNR
ncbi:MAG TPA: 3-deoxy-manno-octulosonate cytidylyltransferase [Thermoanaerobaculaceae bacterium]|nr:3-deoxy-manno-octulosonate cytidylyltransferase [Thermoanaerobaculaceae bacterium]